MGNCFAKKKQPKDSPPKEHVRPSFDSELVLEVVSKDDFNKKITAAEDNLVVVDFYATWCGPCKMVKPHYAKLAEEFSPASVTFLKVDVDKVEDVTNEYGISSMPTFVLIRKSKKVDEITGANMDRLRTLIVEHSSGKGQQAGDSVKVAKT